MISAPRNRTPYNYDRKAASILAGLKCNDPSLTEQLHKDDCDINVILARFTKGVQPNVPAQLPSYDDFSQVNDYRSALHAVMEARDTFAQLSSKIRAQFDNDPQQFLEFVSDPRNIDQLRDWGMAKGKPPVDKSVDNPVDK